MKKIYYLKRTTFRKAGSGSFFRVFLLLMLLLMPVTNKAFSSNSILQQNIKLTGIVSDIKGNPLIGVSVIVKGTSISTITSNS